MSIANKKMKKIVAFLIKLYQLTLSPLLGGGKCRFYPSCSQYVLEAVDKHGFIDGIVLGISRFCRCGPWSKGGYDPVPDKLCFGLGYRLSRILDRTSKG
jgi:putative membrane protein insertion efficiency factor